MRWAEYATRSSLSKRHRTGSLRGRGTRLEPCSKFTDILHGPLRRATLDPSGTRECRIDPGNNDNASVDEDRQAVTDEFGGPLSEGFLLVVSDLELHGGVSAAIHPRSRGLDGESTRLPKAHDPVHVFVAADV